MIYFASDTHLGLSHKDIPSRQRELMFVEWLKNLEDCTELYLLGDIFDYWFEYSKVVPKGYVRLLGQLASMVDSGIKISFIAGNHDLWVRDYFKNELGIESYTSDLVITVNGKKILLSHGDALNGNLSLLGKIFRSRFLKILFENLIHPDLSMKFGLWWSHHNRLAKSITHNFMGDEERIVKVAKQVISIYPDLDYIICGHIHTPIVYPLNDKTKLIVLGQWITGIPHFACMNQMGEVELRTYPS